MFVYCFYNVFKIQTIRYIQGYIYICTVSIFLLYIYSIVFIFFIYMFALALRFVRVQRSMPSQVLRCGLKSLTVKLYEQVLLMGKGRLLRFTGGCLSMNSSLVTSGSKIAQCSLGLASARKTSRREEQEFKILSLAAYEKFKEHLKT